ncbi:PAS domain-containing protein [Massariosphaeria phaeospora]|uniref:PAS domain-containing protein n=1 Tax=Massariosphaeria phaeospora TaxID=100035 RepID=A0A7C8M7P6_9PLEO|nr:PAS domain-containing protein [Massariosphaeria phaeospora]
MNGYPTYPPRKYTPTSSGQGIMDMSGDGMGMFAMSQGQSLDDIVSHNEKANRRRSMPVYGGQQMHMDSPDDRRLSMMHFGDPNGGSLDGFQFSMPQGPAMDGLMRGGTFPRTSTERLGERTPTANLAINTQFNSANAPYSAIGPGSAYASPMQPNMPMDQDMTSPYPNAMPMSLDMNDALALLPTDMNMFSGAQFTTPMMDSGNQEIRGPSQGPHPQDPSLANRQTPEQFQGGSNSVTPDIRVAVPTRHNSHEQSSARSASQPSSSNSIPTQISHTSIKGQEPAALPPHQDLPAEAYDQLKQQWTSPPGGSSSSMNPNHTKTEGWKDAYSSTGFDMLRVLMRVATRPNPQIDIGSVDLSCAFVVCDAQKDDCPIVYCSDNFERLTGYTKHMILGRNCRFLQAPDGKVEPGIQRKYCDDSSIFRLKETIANRQETQSSIINYRRGGQPFMNLLTMIPIAWEEGGDMKFYVGFQVDLVEAPQAMTSKKPDGSYTVNYQRGMSMPSYIFNDHHKPPGEHGQTVPKDEVSTILATYGTSNDSEVTRRLWDKVLLENTDDVVHVLSLKGLFLYLSPSSNRVLEYDPSELVGTPLSSVCHPSDIVPVTRELKETGNCLSVNVVFRIRRKNSGYMWFEGHGSLHTEQGKGRKCIILVGRERPVYTLAKTIVRASGGIGDNELWTKMSTSGMFLFVSSNVRQLLDKQPEDMVGTSIQALMRPESKQNFGRILELARTGRKGEVKHEMINKRGQVLQAFTTIYPGDATEGQKPTFLVGQTRLLKHSRSSNAQRPSMYTSRERTSGDSHQSMQSMQSANSGASPLHPGTVSGHTGGSGTPQTITTDARYQTTEESAETFAGNNSLPIGHQDQSLASEENVFDELKTTRSTSWQFELRQMEKRNRYLAEEVQSLLAAKKKRKRRKGAGQLQKDCANCHTRTTPEWRRGPSGNRDLCNSCGLRWAKQNGRVSPRNSSQHSQSDRSRRSASPRHSQNSLSNAIPENGDESSIDPMLAHAGRRTPQQVNSDSHAAKVARMEGPSEGFGGIPPKIEEDIEPD